MDRAEVLVIAHRLRRLMPRNGDVLALTDWVLGSGGREEKLGGLAAEASAELVEAEVDRVRVRMQGEIDALKAAGGVEGCVVCAARKAKDRERLRGVMRRKREKERKG